MSINRWGLCERCCKPVASCGIGECACVCAGLFEGDEWGDIIGHVYKWDCTGDSVWLASLLSELPLFQKGLKGRYLDTVLTEQNKATRCVFGRHDCRLTGLA